MRPTASAIAFLILLIAGINVQAQSPIGISKRDTKFSNLARNGSMFARTSGLNPQARAAVQRFNVRSVPYWGASLTYQGTNYPLYFVGQSLFTTSGVASINTPLIALRLRFLDYIDPATSKPYELDATPQMPNVMSSPNFVSYPYPTGETQFQDAAQRASFYGYYEKTWHTLLTPRQVRTVTLDVPAGRASLYYLIEDPSVIWGVVDREWAGSQFLSIISSLNIPVESFPILISHNIVLVNDVNTEVFGALGLHGAYFSKQVGITYFIQTWAWADWPSSELSFLGGENAFALSHEIAEWMNDPFVINTVPRWQWVDNYNYTEPCSLSRETSLFEVADPVQNYSGYPITLHGFTYSMTNQVGVSWFERDVPSTGLHGAYSFPDESIATGPALSCP